MQSWTREDLSADIDGVTDTFSVSDPYNAGQLLPRVNGNTLVEGVTEIPPSSFQLPFAPKLGDHLVVYYFKNV